MTTTQPNTEKTMLISETVARITGMPSLFDDMKQHEPESIEALMEKVEFVMKNRLSSVTDSEAVEIAVIRWWAK